MQQLTSPEQLDEKDWLVLRLMKAMTASGAVTSETFTKAVLWVFRRMTKSCFREAVKLL